MIRRQSGVSLVETMVGITVGLITVLLITQIMSSFQASRNSISFGADAQENGLFALQTIATDVRGAGAGYYSSNATTQTSVASCSNVCTRGGTQGWCSSTSSGTSSPAIPSMSGISPTPNKARIPGVPLAPVLIDKYENCCTAGSSGVTATYAGNSDVLTIRSAARLSGALPTAVSASSISAPIGVTRTFGAAVGDLALIADDTTCALIQVTGITGSTLEHTSGGFNPISWDTTPTFASSAQVFNIGNYNATDSDSATLLANRVHPQGAIIAKEYSIPCIAATGSGTNCRGSTLQLRRMDFGATDTLVPDTMADGIVALRAQYGVAAQINTLAIIQWVGTDWTSSDGVSTWGNTWDPSVMTPAKMQLIRAVRIFVVARSGNKEVAEVTQACGTTGYELGPCPSGSSTQGDTTMPALKLGTSATDAAWKHYRYKVYSTVIPLRNVLWNLQ